MKQESNKRLYFTNDFSPENVAELQAQGYTLRKASAYHEADTLEACAEVAGDVPQAYLDLIKRNKANIVTANVQVSITPELQKVIDDAKAECEKVVAENAGLKEQIQTLKADLTLGEPADLSGLIPAEQFDAVAQKLTETEDQLNKEREAVKKLTAEKDALLTQVKDLESKLKKQTAAEAKAAKAAEAKTEQPKE
ncbi:HeH/LEM domain protein [Acinetobacter haemolyticus]|uniref:HeH/LEM domain protein n=1 Tax=Acinetobacter haemolyticus TaxID=29430 RepID=UPI001331E1E7|nr:HeH/LEM domain protein [Acinetobacter haemolyticus]QHI16239.1 HeH/LEM domain protein [Acinetobacter haemolyticus]QHI17076.1 HeH/LEM domain protein [Acinetobacter haemolyticus]